MGEKLNYVVFDPCTLMRFWMFRCQMPQDMSSIKVPEVYAGVVTWILSTCYFGGHITYVYNHLVLVCI